MDMFAYLVTVAALASVVVMPCALIWLRYRQERTAIRRRIAQIKGN